MMKVDGKKITFKTANEDEVRNILDTIYQPLGWGLVLEDYLAILQHDPKSVTVAVHENGEIIAGVAFMKINDTAAGFGSYCVKEEYQGKGIGSYIHKIGVERVLHLNVTLTAVENMFEKYRTVGGYPVVSKVKGVRYSGEIDKSNIKISSDVLIMDYTANMLQDLLQYDKTVVSLERDDFMKIFLPLVKGSIVIAQKNGNMCGYGILRGDTHRLGPIFADDSNIALTIVAALLERSASQVEVIIDIPDCNTVMLDLAKKNNMKWIFTIPRMFSKEEIQSNWKMVHALHSVEVMYI